MEDQDLYSGLIRLHVLHHAVEEPPIFGFGMIEELARHGYRISPGGFCTPCSNGWKKKGYSSSEKRDGNRDARSTVPRHSAGKPWRLRKVRLELFSKLIEGD